MFFSVIVPVYNVEEYLHKCVDSILSQSFVDFELILVNDGSTDRSPEICDDYCAEDKRVKVIHKTNGGLSSARNAGLDVAEGNYIVFVDSDDWIEERSLESFYMVLQSRPVDVLMTVKTSVYPDEQFLEVEGFDCYLKEGFSKDRAIDWLLFYCKSVGAPNKIVRRTLIEKNSLRFLEGILHEDYDWTFKLCLTANSYYGYDGAWYNYRMIREDSITNKITAKNITSVIYTTRIYYDLYRTYPDSLHKKIYHRSMNALYGSINKIKKIEGHDVDEVKECLKENRDIFRYAGKVDQALFLLVMRGLGTDVAVWLLRKLG